MVDTTPRRRKRSGYPERLSLQVTPAMKRALEDMADRLELDVAEIGRRAIEAGLPGLAPPIIAVEALVPDVQPEPVSAEEVRVWWDGLTHRARTRWGKRLHHIDDVAAFRAEAYRQAQGGKAHMKDNILLAQLSFQKSN